MSPAAVVPLEIRPGTSMTGVLALLDELDLLAGAGEEVRRQVDELTGLRSGELQALLAVAAGADRPAAVAEATGQVDDAATATVEALRRRGLVTGEPGAALLLTENGRVVRQQAEGLRIRLLHGVVSALGEQATGSCAAPSRRWARCSPRCRTHVPPCPAEPVAPRRGALGTGVR